MQQDVYFVFVSQKFDMARQLDFVDESLAIRGFPLKWLYSTNRDQKIVTNSNLPMTIVLSNSMIVPHQKGIEFVLHL